MAKRFTGTKTNGKRKEWKGAKRAKNKDEREATEDLRKRRRVDDASLSISQQSPSHSGSSISDESTYEKPPAFEALLEALYSGNQSRVGGRRGEEEEASGEEDGNSSSEYETGDSEEDNDGEEDLNHKTIQGTSISEVESEGYEEAASDELSSSDDEEGDGSDESESEGPPNNHFGVILSNEEVEKLTKKPWKFKWEMPMIGSSSSKWIGTGECLSEDMNKVNCCGLVPKLYNHWLKEYEAFGGGDFHSSRQRQFFSLCSSYRDIMHCSKRPFYHKGTAEDSDITDSYVMHAINHVFQARDLVIKNDAKLVKDNDTAKEELLNGDNFRDQGFTRPKVLFLLPYRSFALRLIKKLIHLTPLSKKGNVEHLSRFLSEFGTDDNKDENDDDMLPTDSRKSAKPDDHQVLFGGNNDDCFMIGIKFTRRSIKLYADFYSCDMIVASPLGMSKGYSSPWGDCPSHNPPHILLKKIAETTNDKEKDVDYLSSIEVLIIDHADVIAMQNWAHLTTVVEQLNHLPSKQHRSDFMRVKQWYLEGQARFYRQTILLSYFPNPDMNMLFKHLCLNHGGKLKTVCHHKGILPKVLLPVKQVYERFDASSLEAIGDARFNYFVKKVYPKIKDSIEGGIMLFISCYLDFLRIRNFLRSQNASFCLLGEYTKQSDVSRARVWFFQGTRKMMLYTERAHFYRRYKIRGIQHLYLYSLPERKEFYPEILNMLGEAKNAVCSVIFSRFDHLRLERIVGTAAAKRLVSSEKSMFIFS